MDKISWIKGHQQQVQQLNVQNFSVLNFSSKPSRLTCSDEPWINLRNETDGNDSDE